MSLGVGSWRRRGPQPPCDARVEEPAQLGHGRELPDRPGQRRRGGGCRGLSPDRAPPRAHALRGRADGHCHGAWWLSGRGACLTQEVAIRTVKQSAVLREAENGEEGDEEGADFGEEDLFHQQVRGAPGDTGVHSSQPGTDSRGAACRASGLADVGLGQCPGDPGRRVLKAERLSGDAQPWGLGEHSLVPPPLVWETGRKHWYLGRRQRPKATWLGRQYKT